MDHQINLEQMVNQNDAVCIDDVKNIELLTTKEIEVELTKNEEMTSNDAITETNYSIGNNKCLDLINIKKERAPHRPKRTPLVYTTRLDEMKIFKEQNLTMLNIISNVNNESKPVLASKINFSHPYQPSKNIRQLSFYVMKYKLDVALGKEQILETQTNKSGSRISVNDNIVKNYDLCKEKPDQRQTVNVNNPIFQAKNKILLSVCRPLSIVIEDFRKTASNFYELNKDSTQEKSSGLLSFKIDLEKIEYASFKNSPNSTFSKIATFQKVLLVLYENQTDLWHTYDIDDSGNVLCYYKTLSVIPSLMHHNTTPAIEKSICCWYNRKKFVQNCKLINYNMQRFLINEHNCKSSMCICCCKPQLVHDVKKDLVPGINEVGNNQGTLEHDDLFTKLKKTRVSERRSSKLINMALKYRYIHAMKRKTAIEIKVENLIKNKIIQIKNTITNEIEVYEIGENSQINTFVKYQQNDNTVCNKLDLTKPKIFGTCCCWVKRELIILKLCNQKLAPAVVSFIRKPHLCIQGKCRCCCSFLPVAKPKTKLQEIKLTVRGMDLKNKNKIRNPVIYTGTRKTQNVSAINRSPQPQMCNENPEDSQQVDPSSVQQCIKTILETFRGVSLTIDNRGKVAANLNIPVNNLSMTELKILANIISCAQEQVDSLRRVPNPDPPLDNNILNTDIATQRSHPSYLIPKDKEDYQRLKQCFQQPIPQEELTVIKSSTIPTTDYRMALDCYRDVYSHKRECFKKSFGNFFAAKSVSSIPLIKHVYSIPENSVLAPSLNKQNTDSSTLTIQNTKISQTITDKNINHLKVVSTSLPISCKGQVGDYYTNNSGPLATNENQTIFNKHYDYDTTVSSGKRKLEDGDTELVIGKSSKLTKQFRKILPKLKTYCKPKDTNHEIPSKRTKHEQNNEDNRKTIVILAPVNNGLLHSPLKIENLIETNSMVNCMEMISVDDSITDIEKSIVSDNISEEECILGV